MKPLHPNTYKIMKIKHLKHLFTIGLVLLFMGCVSNKKMLYFQESDQVNMEKTLVNFEPAIQPGDLITILVSATDPLSAQTFNLYEAPTVTNNPRLLPYLVDSEGSINFPVLGKLKVAGFTTHQIGNQVTEALTAYLVEPIVNVRLTNFKITVMGEVKSPGTYTIPNQRITIVEALGLAGDLTIQAKRKSITIVREQNGKRDFAIIDLTNKKLFNSPYYYLAQNDVIYVQPNKAKVNSSSIGAGTSVVLSSIGILISLITLLSI
jgi:polysaccharide export outer membrane protein